ncbi:hypothetical protein ABZ356_13105 [Micromonospora zamorensis]
MTNWVTNWVTTGAGKAGRPWTAVDGLAQRLAQLIAGWWFLRDEGVKLRQ